MEEKYKSSMLQMSWTPAEGKQTLLSHSGICFSHTHWFCVTNILLILQEKVEPLQAPPLFNEEEKEEKDELTDKVAKSNQVEDTLWCPEEPGAVPVPATDVAGQEAKEKVRDFSYVNLQFVKCSVLKNNYKSNSASLEQIFLFFFFFWIACFIAKERMTLSSFSKIACPRELVLFGVGAKSILFFI